MTTTMRSALTLFLSAFVIVSATDLARAAEASAPLKTPADFAGIADRNARSIALFNEALRVIESPRCANCHPVNRTPTQGDDRHPHVPFIRATTDGGGPPGLTCSACHGRANVSTLGATIQSIPGHEHWGLAPASMSWQQKSGNEICSQIKDSARNGGRSLAKIHEHMATDSLVGWAWRPGDGRAPAPGTQAEFGRLIAAWIATGAVCP